MKYKVGDKVRVIEDLEWDDPRFPTCGVTEEMAALRGKCVTIKGITCNGRYETVETGRWYAWTEEMFSGIADFTLDDLETRMVVETRNGDRYLVFRDQKEIHVMCSDGNFYTKFVGGNYGNHNADMRFPGDTDLDVMTVFPKVDTFEEVKTVNDPIWERKEPKKMTIAEIQKQLGHEVEVIADVKR